MTPSPPHTYTYIVYDRLEAWSRERRGPREVRAKLLSVPET